MHHPKLFKSVTSCKNYTFYDTNIGKQQIWFLLCWFFSVFSTIKNFVSIGTAGIDLIFTGKWFFLYEVFNERQKPPEPDPDRPGTRDGNKPRYGGKRTKYLHTIHPYWVFCLLSEIYRTCSIFQVKKTSSQNWGPQKRFGTKFDLLNSSAYLLVSRKCSRIRNS